MTWEQSWREDRTPWDAGQSPPVLNKLVEAGDLPGGRALVPGCGSGYDVLTLATDERSVLGIDVAPLAAERFEELRREADVSEERATVVADDFFDYEFDEAFDLVWDYTFLCALSPDMRDQWADAMRDLVKPSGELITLIFPVWDADLAPDDPAATDEEAGPPYAMSPGLVESIIGDRFERTACVEVEENTPGRAGMEWLARWQPTSKGDES